LLIQQVLAIAQVGSHVVLYLLMALSVVSIAVILERTLFFRRRRTDPDELGKELLAKVRSHDHAGAKKLLESRRSIEAEVLLETIDWLDAGPEPVQEVLAGAVKKKRKQIESGLLFLGTLGNNAPFIGLFGTVLGIVTAFRELGNAAMGSMGNVMTGIAEALVATAIGIFVAIPAVVAFNWCQKRTVEIEENIGAIGHLILAELRRPFRHGAKDAKHDGNNHRVNSGSHAPAEAKV
jgi:biopolymer transport protein ExbB/TolQ